MRSKNFSFIKKIAPKEYKYLCEMEYNAWLNPLLSAQTCRHLFERILNEIISKNGGRPADGISGKFNQIKENRYYLPSVRELPDIKAKCYKQDGTIIDNKMNAYTFLRCLGNAGSHDDQEPWYDNMLNPIPTTENVFKALSIFHSLLRMIYKDKIATGDAKFNERDIPIGEFFIVQEKADIADHERTHCVKEYLVYRYESDNVYNIRYGLIWEYDTDNVREDESLSYERMLDVYGVLGSQMRRNGIELRKLNEPGTDYTNYFVVCEYDIDMIPLRSLLKRNELDIQTRMKLCLDIAKQLSQFHNAKDHVYLRILTHESIMVRQRNADSISTSYEPLIVRFQFSKIVFDMPSESNQTILGLLQSFSNQNNNINKRISRYCINTEFNDGTDWEKVDVGSLGVLFIDICKGTITTKEPDDLIDEFIERKSVPQEMIDLMIAMTDSDNICRPTLRNVIDEMNRIVISYG